MMYIVDALVKLRKIVTYLVRLILQYASIVWLPIHMCMERHVSQKVYNINLNKTYAVHSTGSLCNLVVYMITRYFINYMVVYKVTW